MHVSPWTVLALALVIAVALAVHGMALVFAFRGWRAKVQGRATSPGWTAAILGTLGYAGMIVLGMIALSLPLVGVASGPSGDPEQRARIVGESVANVMNLTLIAIFALPLSIAFVVFARKRERKG